MKKFFNGYTILLTVTFVIGIISAACAANWVALIWAVVGFLWMLIARKGEVDEDTLSEEYEAKLTGIRYTRDEYLKLLQDKTKAFDAKLKENYDLACENQRLSQEIVRLGELNLKFGQVDKTADREPVVHGNIKIKRKRKSSQAKTDIQDKNQ